MWINYSKSLSSILFHRHLNWVEKPILEIGLLCDGNEVKHEDNFVNFCRHLRSNEVMIVIIIFKLPTRTFFVFMYLYIRKHETYRFLV